MGGTIELDSEEGVGTRFDVTMGCRIMKIERKDSFKLIHKLNIDQISPNFNKMFKAIKTRDQEHLYEFMKLNEQQKLN